MSPRVKKLTADNWLQPEEVMSTFVTLAASGQVQTLLGDDWVKAICTPALADAVPDDIQVLFEVARGALAYGYFFYPLYTLGMEQVLRAAEAAVTHKCRTMGAPQSVERYRDKIEWLVQRGAIAEHRKDTWHAARKLRNMASHPEQQAIVTPGMASGMLQRIAGEIDALFLLA